MIRKYGNTTYLLHLNEFQRDELVRRHKFQIVKLTQNNPETVTLYSQYTIYLAESDKKVTVKYENT